MFLQILVGVKFVRSWPFLGRVRLCFVEPPYFQMTVKPLINHGLDVTEFPGISGWLVRFSCIIIFSYCIIGDSVSYSSLGLLGFFFQDKLMDTAFGQTLVEVRFLLRSTIFVCFAFFKSLFRATSEVCPCTFSLLRYFFFWQPNMIVINVEKFASTPSGR